MVGNLPLTILKGVNERVAGLDLVPGSAHGEFVDTIVHAPVGARRNIGLQDLTLGLLLEEINKVALDAVVVSAGSIAHSREKAGSLGVALGDGVGILGGESTVPELEEVLDLVLGDGRGNVDALGHDGRMVVGNLPELFSYT